MVCSNESKPLPECVGPPAHFPSIPYTGGSIDEVMQEIAARGLPITREQVEAAVENGRRDEAVLRIGTSHMDENALAAFRHQMTNYGTGYLYQDVPRHRGRFYTTAKYSKRGKKRK